MHPETYSWIGLSAAAPLVFLICAWVLGVYHSFRKYWRSVDLFMLALFVQELLTALQAFIYALLSLVKPSSGIFCSAFIWSLSATRALQAATVCSLLVDRALTSQWPYKYRFSVRRHQIRYHLVVLATMAALVGVAAILARPSEFSPNFEDCKFLPQSLHVRLALFLLSLYGILLVIAAVSASVVQTTRTCRGGAFVQADHDLTPITHHGTTGSQGTTGSSTASSVRSPRTQGGMRPLHPLTCSSSTASSSSSGAGRLHSSTTDLISSPNRSYAIHRGGVKSPLGGRLSRPPLDDFRWGASIGVASLCFAVNHIPYMVLLVVGTFFPYLLPAWSMENLSLWLSLLEGLLLPLVLGLCDSTFGDAAKNSCSRQGTSYRAAEPESPFRLKDEVKSFPLTNGSLFSSLHTMNMESSSSPFHLLTSANMKNSHHTPMGRTRMGVLAQDFRGVPHRAPRLGDSFGHFFYNSDEPSSMGSIERGRHAPIYSDPLNKACSMDSSLKDDHIYATLSETFGSSYSSLSDGYLGDHHRCSSATTVANDDFEYHAPKQQLSTNHSHFRVQTRPPAQLPPEALRMNVSYLSSESSSSGETSFRSSTSSDLSESSNSDSDARRVIEIRSSSPRIGFVNPSCNEREGLSKRFFGDTIKQDAMKINIHNTTSHEESKMTPEEGQNTLSKKHRSSSLSMNDLDRLDSGPELDQEEEMMFILPVKSESMLSLYKLYLAEDEESGAKSLRYSIEVSKSEGNLAAPESIQGNERIVTTAVTSPGGKFVKQEDLEPKKRRITAVSSSSSKIRRQHKIQKAKGNIYRAKHSLSTHQESPAEGRVELRKSASSGELCLSSPASNELTKSVKVTVVEKNNKKNGIITIKDPSVLSVEELFSVLGRASKKGDAEQESKSSSRNSSLQKPPQIAPGQSTTEFKKIFVSEYI